MQLGEVYCIYNLVVKELCRRLRALPTFLGLRREDWSTAGELEAFRKYEPLVGNQSSPPEKIPLGRSGRGGIVRISESPLNMTTDGDIPFSDLQRLGKHTVEDCVWLRTPALVSEN